MNRVVFWLNSNLGIWGKSPIDTKKILTDVWRLSEMKGWTPSERELFSRVAVAEGGKALDTITAEIVLTVVNNARPALSRRGQSPAQAKDSLKKVLAFAKTQFLQVGDLQIVKEMLLEEHPHLEAAMGVKSKSSPKGDKQRFTNHLGFNPWW